MKTAVLLICAGLLPAQDLRVATIDFFGIRTIPEQQIRNVLGVREGDTIAPSHTWGDAIKKRIEAIPGVSQVSLDLGCCDTAGRATITVGIVEAGSPAMSFRPAPNSPVRLPAEIVKAYHGCMDAWERAVRNGDNQDNVEDGHSLMVNAEVRAIQQRFIPIARSRLALLRDVLRNSATAEHRAVAAFVIGYAPDKAQLTQDLVYASSDPDQLVRNNAMRSLWAIASLANRKPELKISIPADPFISLLSSIVSSDRNKALAVMHALTEKRQPAILARLRDEARPVLLQMARKQDGFTAYALLARMAGMPEERIGPSWESGERILPDPNLNPATPPVHPKI